MSAVLQHVMKIFKLSSCIQMIWVAATPIAAFVVDLKFPWISVKEEVTGAVSSIYGSVMRPISVAMIPNTVFPQPAFPWLANQNLANEIFPRS